MIISVSRRTDIPAYFGNWFRDILKKGEVQVKNPFHPRQISTVSLKPQDVTAFVFWTRDSKPFIPVIEELIKQKYRFYFLYTINPYQIPLEENLPSLKKQMVDFCNLAELIGKEKIIWRYDPIIISNNTGFEYHLIQFEKITNNLHNFTRKVKISFIDFYKKTIKNLIPLEEQGWNFVKQPEQLQDFSTFLLNLYSVAKSYNLEMTSCSENIDLSFAGIKAGSCIDINLLNRLYNLNLKYKKDPNQRKECKCAISKDIGSYNTCKSGCLYCYAN